ncbi:MAG: Eco57I restriction-modification methylase domain-containing protein, partial [Ktedonobacterales bacterium]
PAPRDLTAEQQRLTHSIEMTNAAFTDILTDRLPFFLYRLHFAPVFERKDGFDIVIANPPYVRHEKINPATLATLKAAYPGVQHGMADLYVYFYARALELLHAGGTLCFISSNKFFRAGYGKGLRETLKDCAAVRLVIDFGDFPVFDASAYPCIVIAANGKPAGGHNYRGLTAGNDIELDKIGATLALAGQTRAQAEGVQPPTGDEATGALVRKLMGMGTPLGKFVGGKMYYGIKTGLNEAFVVDTATRDRLIAEDPRSAEVLKPFLRGRDVGRYAVNWAGLWLLRIATGWTRQSMKTTTRPPEEQAWAHLRGVYPAIAAYLEPFADRCRKRDDKGQYWWELRPCDYYAAFEGAKIVSIRFGLKAGFAFDDKGRYCNDAIYTFAPAPKWLTAVLNSSVCNICLISICPSVQNGYSQFFVNKIEELPIVEPTEEEKRRLEALVERAQERTSPPGPLSREEMGRQNASGTDDMEALEREVDAIVYRTYGLSAEEIALIEAWHAGRRALLGKG